MGGAPGEKHLPKEGDRQNVSGGVSVPGKIVQTEEIVAWHRALETEQYFRISWEGRGGWGWLGGRGSDEIALMRGLLF